VRLKRSLHCFFSAAGRRDYGLAPFPCQEDAVCPCPRAKREAKPSPGLLRPRAGTRRACLCAAGGRGAKREERRAPTRTRARRGSRLALRPDVTRSSRASQKKFFSRGSEGVDTLV